MTLRERIFAIVVTVLANTCAGIATQHIFQDGSTTAKVVSVLGIVSLNMLALVTKPVASKGAAAPSLPESAVDKAASQK